MYAGAAGTPGAPTTTTRQQQPSSNPSDSFVVQNHKGKGKGKGKGKRKVVENGAPNRDGHCLSVERTHPSSIFAIATSAPPNHDHDHDYMLAGGKDGSLCLVNISQSGTCYATSPAETSTSARAAVAATSPTDGASAAAVQGGAAGSAWGYCIRTGNPPEPGCGSSGVGGWPCSDA